MRTFVLGFGIHICTQKQYDMKFVAEIDIMPLPALLDPQGKAVGSNMGNMGLPEIVGVRIGKHVTLEVEASDKAVAEKKVKVVAVVIENDIESELFSFWLDW